MSYNFIMFFHTAITLFAWQAAPKLIWHAFLSACWLSFLPRRLSRCAAIRITFLTILCDGALLLSLMSCSLQSAFMSLKSAALTGRFCPFGSFVTVCSSLPHAAFSTFLPSVPPQTCPTFTSFAIKISSAAQFLPSLCPPSHTLATLPVFSPNLEAQLFFLKIWPWKPVPPLSFRWILSFTHLAFRSVFAPTLRQFVRTRS